MVGVFWMKMSTCIRFLFFFFFFLIKLPIHTQLFNKNIIVILFFI